MARYFKNIGGKHRRANGSIIEQGAICRLVPGPVVLSGDEVSYREVDSNRLRWLEQKDYQPPEPEVASLGGAAAPVVPNDDGPVAPELNPATETEKPEQAVEGEPDPTPYHKGGAYYDIPNVGMVKGRAKAILALKAALALAVSPAPPETAPEAAPEAVDAEG